MIAHGKTLLRRLCRVFGFQIVPLTREQQALLAQYPTMRYRHFSARDAIVMDGQIGIAEARFLGDLVSGLQAHGPIVEIGTLFGWSTRIIALFKDADRELITVDNYSWNPIGFPADYHFQITRQVLADAAKLHVRIERMSSADFYNQYDPPPPALVFIDASHEYHDVSGDIAGAKRIGARIICGHDYHPRFPGVVRAVGEAGGPERLLDSMWVL